MNTSRAVLLKAGADLATKGLALVTFPIFATYAGAEGYGAYGQLNTIVALVVPFATLGLASAIVRFFAGGDWTTQLRDRLLRLVAIVLVSSSVFTVAMAVAAPALGDALLGWPDSTELLRWGSLLVALGALELVLLESMRARGWLVMFSVFQLTQAVLMAAAVVVLLPSGYGIVDLVKATIIIKAATIVAWVVTIAFRRRPAAGDVEAGPAPDVGTLVRFGLPFTVAGLGLFLMNLGDRLVIGHFMTPADLGRYGAVYAFASLLLLTSAPLYLPAYPRVMRAVLDRKVELEPEVRLFHRYLALVLLPAAAWLVVVIPPTLLLMGGDEFHASYLLAALIVGGLLVNQWNGLAYYLLPAFDRTVFLQNAYLGCGALNALLNVIVVPVLGLSGAGAVTLVTFVLLDVCVLWVTRRYLDLRRAYSLGATWRAAVCAAAAALCAYLALQAVGHSAVGLVAATGLFLVVYVAGVVLARELRGEDVRVVLQAFRRTSKVVQA